MYPWLISDNIKEKAMARLQVEASTWDKTPSRPAKKTKNAGGKTDAEHAAEAAANMCGQL